jgi:peptidoglycan/LPS O-acetylase OafA/YrhL
VGRILLFCGLVLCAASVDLWDETGFAARLSLLGNITYGLYLLHVPVQIAIILLMDRFSIDRGIAATRPFFLGFIGLMLILATLSYRYFELPMRRWVRELFEVGQPASG